MMEYARKKQYNPDFHDICSEAWECLKEHIKK
jgi:hypothetical protein